MLHSFKECSASNQYGNNTKANANHTYQNNKIKNNNNNNYSNKELYQTNDIRSLANDSSVIHNGTTQNSQILVYVEPTLLSKTHEKRELITNMHSSGVTADTTAVIVNISGSDNNNTDSSNAKLQRSGSKAAYSEVAYHAGRRERKISSSFSLTNQQQASRNTPHGGRHSGSRIQSTRHEREQTPKLTESPKNTSRKQNQSEGSIEQDANCRTSKKQYSRQQLQQLQQTSRSRHRTHGGESTSSSSAASSCNGSCSSNDNDSNTTSTSGEPNLPYPGFPEIALKYLTQDTRPRSWCLKMITNPYPF